MNVMAGLVLVASWTIGIIVAIPQPWLRAQLLGTALLVSLTGWALRDYATIRRRTRDGFAHFDPSF